MKRVLIKTESRRGRRSAVVWPRLRGVTGYLFLGLVLAALAGCRGVKATKQNQDFFTSGSREADQRASQRMAKAEQLAGSGEDAGEKGVKKAVPAESTSAGTNKAAQAQGKMSLYERLGGEPGVSNIVADFTPRVLQDPRVNWARVGVRRGVFSLHNSDYGMWTNSAGSLTLLKKHVVEFLVLATGGPAHYEGRGIRATHGSMHIANAEFDAAIGDIKASLDNLRIPNKEQKELLAIIESTRPEIVAER